jgi:hypothetical protein
MQRVIFSALLVLLSAACELVYGADTNIKDVLDKKLATKQPIERDKIVPTSVEDCAWSGEARSDKCKWRKSSKTERVQDMARIKSAKAVQVLTVRDLRFETERLVSLPEEVVIQRGQFFNCHAPTLNASVSLSVTGSEGWSISKTSSIASTATVSLTGAFTAGNFNTALGISQSITLSSSTNKSEDHSKAVSRSYSGSVSLAQGQSALVELFAYQTEAEVPFSATVVVDGDLEKNHNGFVKASDILSEAERTIPFAGTARIKGLSEGIVRQREAEYSDCDEVNIKGRRGKIIEDEKRPAGFLQVAMRPSVAIPSGGGGASPTPTPVPSATIAAPPDGIHYNIVARIESPRPTPLCGFNSTNAQKQGIYVIEKRHYEHWSNGKMISQWNEDIPIFQNCAPGP